MCARDLALPSQPPFCCFSHRCSFHFLSWQFRLGVEAGVVPGTQGFPSCAKSGLGGQVLPHPGVPKGTCPTGASPGTRAAAPCPAPGTMPVLGRGSSLQSPPTPTPPPPAHTHFRAAWTKESVLLSSLSALLGTCVFPPPPPLPCLSSTSQQGHHTHAQAHVCNTLAATCSHT